MTTTESISNIIKAHKDAIADLDTIQTILGELSDMIKCEDVSPLYHLSFEEDETLYQLINPRAPQIVADIIDLISEHYLLAINFPVETVPDDAPMEKVFITPREG